MKSRTRTFTLKISVQGLAPFEAAVVCRQLADRLAGMPRNAWDGDDGPYFERFADIAHWEVSEAEDIGAESIEPSTQDEQADDSDAQAARDLIEESCMRDKIVTAPWTEGLAAELVIECDGSVDANGVVEYWADDPDDDDGMLWRVHLTREDVSR